MSAVSMWLGRLRLMMLRLLLARMRIDVGQRLEYGLGSWWRCGQQITLWMVTMLVGRVGHCDRQTLLGDEMILAMHIVVRITSLLGTNAVGYVKLISKVAMTIFLLALLRLGMGVIIVGTADGNQQRND